MSEHKCTAQQASERLKAVQANRSFLSFCSMISLRVAFGRFSIAMEMIQSVGCSPEIAYKIMDGWTVDSAWNLSAKACEELQITRHVLSAIRFSYFINDIDKYDWMNLSVKAMTAVRKTTEEAAKNEKH